MLWGVAATYGIAWWLPGMVSDYLHVSALGGWYGFFFVAVGLAGVYFALFAAWLSWLTHTGTVGPLMVAAGWGACEFARANLIIGNPWALVGYSQIPFSHVMQIADTTGPYGVGMFIAAVSACVAGCSRSTLRGRLPSASYSAVLLMLGSVLGYGEWRLSQTFTIGEPISIAVVQGAISREMRWDPKQTKANLERYLALSKETAIAQPALLFWPEYAVTFYLQVDSPLTESVLHLSRDLKTDLILGGPHYSYGLTNMLQHNAVFLIHEGKLASRYDKVQLVPFAEENRFGAFFSNFPSTYEPGNHFHSLRTKAARVGAFVCFEALAPELVRNIVEAGAEVLANPSNDDWFGNAAAARQHLDIASVRAIENRRYLVRATTSGFSAIVDPYGRITAISNFGNPETVTASVQRSQAQTPYQQWGDVVSYGAIGLVVVSSLYRISLSGKFGEEVIKDA
jgi:apolipoprotein N-acyltransferase